MKGMTNKNQKTIQIFDTTLRDGEQTPGVSLTADDKIEIANQLSKLGVDIIEAGFPSSSEGERKVVKDIAKLGLTSRICALSRATKKDIDAAWYSIKDAVSPRIHTFLATSPIHMEHKLKMSPDKVLMNIDDGGWIETGMELKLNPATTNLTYDKFVLPSSQFSIGQVIGLKLVTLNNLVESNVVYVTLIEPMEENWIPLGEHGLI